MKRLAIIAAVYFGSAVAIGIIVGVTTFIIQSL